MPTYDADELRGLIAEGDIVGFTLDTNIIDGLNTNGNLDNRILQSLANLKAKKVAIILSDVVAKEVRGHMAQRHAAAHDQLASSLKSYCKIWKEHEGLVEELADKLAPADAIGAHSEAILEAFCEKVGMEIISSNDAIGMAELIENYFENRPPFAGADKKHEFPDAIALAALDKWSQEHGAILAVSKDKGWAAYCEESEYLYCANDLGKALALFHEDEAIVARFLASLRDEPDGEFAGEVISAIQRDIDNLDFQVEASAFMEWDAEVEEAVVDSIEYAGGNEQRIVASDGQGVTFLVPVTAKLRVQAGFNFSIHDSIDDDYVSLGGTAKEVTIDHRYQVTVTISGKGSNDIEVDDAAVNPATRLRVVEFGHVEPFYEPEPD
ncbi:PIN domain-containing protein [Mesorhizobium sp. CA7]|uniref:PIN domain-containing protein n=1 Tax=Mesorhizobium sp. CA7 TaxID=588501 RepID=UPI001CCC16C6|nr:PIN domain-containing protein [Mesorhizobium sp. CA7]MBZ9817346.1 PIN domain-containing protein [Mesorhizobium sp. CA7]